VTKGRGADVDPAHGETISGNSVREGLWDGEAESIKSKHSCFGFVEGEIVALENVAEVVKRGRDAVAVGWRGNKEKGRMRVAQCSSTLHSLLNRNYVLK
jgi:hypothetical protein